MLVPYVRYMYVADRKSHLQDSTKSDSVRESNFSLNRTYFESKNESLRPLGPPSHPHDFDLS